MEAAGAAADSVERAQVQAGAAIERLELGALAAVELELAGAEAPSKAAGAVATTVLE